MKKLYDLSDTHIKIIKNVMKENAACNTEAAALRYIIESYENEKTQSEKITELVLNEIEEQFAERLNQIEYAVKETEKESLLWKTVISFDNRWLDQYGIYNMKKDVLNEAKMREVIRKGVNRMLANEGLQHALWSAGIHYDRAYKEARKTFYGSEIQEADPEKGIVLYEKEAEKGNILAVFDLAEIYKKEKNQKSEEYYRKAKEGWEKIYQRRNLKESQRGTIAYKLAKCYDRGYGVERDVESAKKYYQIAEDRQNIYAASGDMKSAGVWLSRSIKNGNILSANLYMHEIEKLGNGQKIGNISKIKQQINQSMNEFLNSMHKDYEAWKNIIEHDQMLQNERNMEREDLSNQEI